MKLLPLIVALSCGFSLRAAEPLARADWGAPLVDVTSAGPGWTIAGRRNTVTLDARDLTVRVQAGPVTWAMTASQPGDIRIKAGADEFAARLADAQKISVARFDTGARTGVKVTLTGWKHGGATAEVSVYLTLALEGPDEELVCEVAADETHGAAVRQLDWPAALDARQVDDTVLNHYRGILLPRNWPKAYNPIRDDPDYPNDTSEIQSDVVECWSQSWWGFERGGSAMMVIVETPDDAAYQWSHPAGGPTVIGPRWRGQLGRLGYVRTARLVFFPAGNYVTLAQRYRRYAMETGTWVPLREKIARSPQVAALVGGVEARLGILRNIVPESRLFKKGQPEVNHTLTTFDQRAQQLRDLKAKGIERFNLVLTGWPHLGYDRQHPDALPVAPEAGGWEGMKRLADACQELGYMFTLHDQYRDYYVDAPSFRPEFAVHEETPDGPATLFPGTRFGSWKENSLSYLAAWDGGKQTYLGSRFMLEHLRKNYAALFAHGIHPQGSYLDVFGYVPPDQDFNPEHPTTRTDAKREIARCYEWVRANLGTVGTEAGCDWTVPYTDYSSPLGPGKAGIPVPLFNLVYHDAVITQYSPRGGEARMNREDRPNWLYGLLNGAPARIDLRTLDEFKDVVARMSALHRRVALLPMTNHEFLDPNHQRERTTFGDGTTVTVDWTAKTATIVPEVE